MLVSEAFQHFIFEEIKMKNGAKKTQVNYQSACGSLLRALGDFPITLLTLQHMTRWKMDMDSRGNSSSTIHHQLCRVRAVLRFMKKRGFDVLDFKDIELPRVEKSRPTYLEYGEVQKIVDAATNERDKAILSCLFSTGCRVSELLNLNRDEVLSQEVTVLGKGSKYRRVYIDKQAWECLQAYLDTRTDKNPALFLSGQYRRITVSRVEQIIHVLASEAGIDKNVTPHVFRHSYASDLVKNGADIMAVKDLMGHTNVSTTQIYTHLSQKHLKEQYEKHHSNR